ncbi:CGNR zinc finger domain-containing protein [Amycolatopsis sp. NBRC 101858]|uniref:CGNR zinc finger domain-containing protein n=1 Tax=Amycolatopsis sp. NBRC 101858 TaxID=3032200 RepID=UPI0025561760|nr:CGNR zinc finger domain-containing protein [Amycolatopsis sp. NBRC 101858]
MKIGQFRTSVAPGGLRLVQELVNTTLAGHRDDPGRDQLADPATATGWAVAVLGLWAENTGAPRPETGITPGGLPSLRTLREDLRVRLRASAPNIDAPPAHEPGPGYSAEVRLALDPGGRARYEGGLVALVLAEVLLAQTTGTWPRLKTCAAPACGVCFYDASPNRSRVWHDTKTCGNLANLHASRARK